MAGSISVDTHEVTNNIVRYRVTWTSDASGNVNGNTFDMMVGTIVCVEFQPGTGALQPDSLYDVDMLDLEGTTMFDDGSGTSIGTNLSNTASTHHVPLVGLTGVTIYRRWHHGGPVQPTVSGAGASNQGIIDVFVISGVL